MRAFWLVMGRGRADEWAMHAAFRAIAQFLESPAVQAVLGLCLLLSGGAEILADLGGETAATPGTHHGVAMFGLAHTLRQVPELAEGASKLLWGAEVAEEAEDAARGSGLADQVGLEA